MRYSERFSHWNGVLVLVVLLTVLGVAMMPACSKKTGEEAAPPEQAAVSEQVEESMAAVPQEQAPAAGIEGERQEAIRQLQQLQADLIKMQVAVMNKHPELLTEQEKLSSLIEEKKKAIMGPQNVNLEEIQEFQKKVQDESLPEEEKAELMTEFQKKVQLYQQGRAEAMNDEEVQKAYKQYADHMKEAMIAENPQALEKMESFDKIQGELQGAGERAEPEAVPLP